MIQAREQHPMQATEAVICCRVALDVPLPGPFDYWAGSDAKVGLRAIVPFGKRRLIGVITAVGVAPSISGEQIRPIERVLQDLPPLPQSLMELAEFAATYYQRPLGEVIIPALPTKLRLVSSYESKRAGSGPLRKFIEYPEESAPKVGEVSNTEMDFSRLSDQQQAVQLNADQMTAVQAIIAAKGFSSFLLHGVTGSGKTQVYLSAAAHILQRGGRVLVMVPEINLTPQFSQAMQRRLGKVIRADELAIMHSRLADGERLSNWMAIYSGRARLVLGTRLAVFAPLAQIDMIVVDEEHDPSYKQQEGLRYSARDLAVWRARQENAVIVLGSATPSLETWFKAQKGHYGYLAMPTRATSAALPQIRLIDTRRLTLKNGLAPQLIEAIELALQKKQQVLIYLNRRGYAPVLHCQSCGWVSHCNDCSAYSVLHRSGPQRMRLHCHHCGAQRSAPASCPQCGDPDLQPMGRGTQRLQEHLQSLFPDARIIRIDADSTRRKGSAEELFDQVHEGHVDILVGTQMISKGHDFSNLALVGVLNADAMLFSQDFRAPERLFAQLMQVAGRAGRATGAGEVLIQTAYPEQPVYQALKKHDFAGYAETLLAQRELAALPPYTYQALLSAQAKELSDAMDFLYAARTTAELWLKAHGLADQVSLYDAVPLRVVKVAGYCRAQLLLEAQSRTALHRLLRGWLPGLGNRHGSGQLRWALEVDPLEI